MSQKYNAALGAYELISRNNNTIAVKQQDFIKEHEIKNLLFCIKLNH